MVLRFQCPCGQKLKTADEVFDKKAKCPKCDNWLRVPQSDTYDTVGEVVPGKPRVVVADSSPEDLDTLTKMLKQHGYKVIKATNGPEAVDMIRAEKPDAAILDMRLDILSGFQVVDHIHNPSNPKNDKIWRTPVLMTADTLRGRDKQYSMSKGVKAFFTKPITPAQICSRLDKEIHRQAEDDAINPQAPGI
jgi:CheY-like chemotaxis protein